MTDSKTPTWITAFANGRVNLIGEHTDYNDGWVLPTAIPQRTDVRLRLRDDRRVVVRTTMKGAHAADYVLGEEKKSGQWYDYIMGATKLVAMEPGVCTLRGFELEIESTVPTGSGLSSSAAIEIAVLKAMREAFGFDLDDVRLAQIGRAIENDFVGANVGIMDQMACALAKFGEALFLDTQTMKYESVILPLEAMDLIVINSGVEHNHAGGDYNERVRECRSACKQLGVSSLRQATAAMIESSQVLGDVERKRARHVVTENLRVHEAVAALQSRDLGKLGRLFAESHASMRDDYQVSVPEIDSLVEISAAREDIYGARLTGGGFGGSIVALAHKGKGLIAAREIVAAYKAKTGQTATILVPQS